MNTKILVAFLAVLSLPACVVYESDHGGGGGYVPPPPSARPGDVTFTWSFAGRTCHEVPSVRSVVIQIPGESLQNNGVYPCLANNYPGIVLHDFAPGAYRFDIQALGYSHERLFTGTGTFTVNGDRRVTIDLTPVGGPTSFAYLAWRFPANSASSDPSCEQAGVAFVDVRVDNGPVERYRCGEGQTDPGAQTDYLWPGMHTIEMTAVSSGNYPFYRFSGALETFAGRPIIAEYDLSWAVGGTAIRWQMSNGANGLSCSQAGVQTMVVNFQDAQGNLVYGQAGDVQACDAAPIVYNFLMPGTYRVFVKGTGPNGVTYLSNAQDPPVVTVFEGRFVTASQAITVPLYRAH